MKYSIQQYALALYQSLQDTAAKDQEKVIDNFIQILKTNQDLPRYEQIIEAYEEKIPMSLNDLRQYLTDNISFRLDEPMRRGLQLYFELAFKHQLIDAVKPLRFV